jgi:hypothetical protein
VRIGNPLPFFSDGSGDYLGLAGTSPDWGAGTAPSSLKSYTGFNGTYLTGMDLDGEGASVPIMLEWTGINISGLTSLEFTGSFAEVFDSPGDIDGDDSISLYYQVDGGGFTPLLWFSGADYSSTSGPFNGVFRQDTDFNGTGDGITLTDTLTSFTVPITATGSTLDLRMEIHVDAGDEDFAVDDFSIQEATTAAPPNVQINELGISDTGIDAEFFELFGASGTSLDNTYLIGIHANDSTGDPDRTGKVQFVLDLSANTIQADGFFTGSSPQADATYTFTSDYAFADETFDNASTTYALVYNPAGILLAAGDDLDTNDDGTLDIVPWTDVVDTVAQTEDLGTEIFYFGAPVVGPDESFLPAGAYRCPDGGTFDPGNILSFTPENGTPDSTNDPLCTVNVALSLIHDVQGGPGTYTDNNFTGVFDESPEIGKTVQVQGVVVGDFQEGGEFDGFFVQEEISDEDGDPATSEGIFVFCDTTCADVSIGNIVTVTGNVDEYFSQTQIDNDNGDLNVVIDDAGNNLSLVSAATVSFPLTPPATDTDPDPKEAYEGMLVSVDTDMRVTEYFQYGRYTQTRVWNDGSGADRPYQFTQTNAPSVAGFEAAELAFQANSFFIDDGSADQKPTE